MEQRLTFSGWTNHLQEAYFDRTDLPGWTLEHPYANPLAPLLRGLPPLNNSLRHPPRPWYQSGIGRQDYSWVELDKSFQWQGFQRLVDVLQRRGNRLFVLVGPFNRASADAFRPRAVSAHQGHDHEVAGDQTDSPSRSVGLAERALRRREPSPGWWIRDAGEGARKEFFVPVVGPLGRTK